ncbi:hypothetical protein LTS17_006296 [Exophiala oligosperma]
MSRLYHRSNRGRQPVVATPKFPNLKQRLVDAYQAPNAKKNKPSRKQAVTNKKRKRTASTSSESSLTDLGTETGDEASDEESDEEEADDEDDLPAVSAPSRSRTLNGAGRKVEPRDRDDISVAPSVDSMFGDYADYYEEDDDPMLSPEENRKRFEHQVFDSDDENDIYQAVDDISDSDAEMDEGRLEEQELLAMLSEEGNSDADFLLNQIDGLSAYGFGDDSDASIQRYPSSQSESGDTGVERHVHFAVDNDPSLFLTRMSESPTITRALLPSALPESGVPSIPERRFIGLADDDDSDLTDDCLPTQPRQPTQHDIEPQKGSSPSTSPSAKKASKKTPRRRGPPRGIFIDDGNKTSGILDPSGKIILMTNPHLLGEEFARRYGASQTSSPDIGFAELIEDSDAGDADTSNAGVLGAPGADIMLASLNSAINDPANLGQAIGPLEAFYPNPNFVLGDFAIDPDDLEENFRPIVETGEDVMDLRDVIKFDDETDDSDAPTSPIFMPPKLELSASGEVRNQASPFSNNIMAFRRDAEARFAVLDNTPKLRGHVELFNSPFATPTPNKRRRKNHASPYTSSHYKGVTPVQRMWDPTQPQTPEASTPTASKRRKVMI